MRVKVVDGIYLQETVGELSLGLSRDTLENPAEELY